MILIITKSNYELSKLSDKTINHAKISEIDNYDWNLNKSSKLKEFDTIESIKSSNLIPSCKLITVYPLIQM